MIKKFLQAAYLGQAYTTQLETQGTVTVANLPAGLTCDSSGKISGTPTQSCSKVLTVTDSSGESYSALLSVIESIPLTDVTVDQAQFVTQLQEAVAKRGTWSTGIATSTGQTLLELIAAIGTYETSKIIRAFEDSFPSTAQSAAAQRAIAVMQGIRLSRKLPTQLQVTLAAQIPVTIPAFTQFTAGGLAMFNSTPFAITPEPQAFTLKEGKVETIELAGLGCDNQVYIGSSIPFGVSDVDVRVLVNGSPLQRVTDGLWNCRGVNAFEDSTLPDGRLKLQFGSSDYGCVPKETDTLKIQYAVTHGLGAVKNLSGVTVRAVGYDIDGTVDVTTGLTGGMDERPAQAYKHLSAGAFGKHGNAVTPGQYRAMVNEYPGVLDATTRSQRELDPTDVKRMNIIQVSALTNTPWTDTEIATYLAYCENSGLYPCVAEWVEPEAVDVDVDVDVYFYNSVESLDVVAKKAEAAVTQLFTPRTGYLNAAIYLTDIQEAITSVGKVSHMNIASPTSHLVLDTKKVLYNRLRSIKVTPHYSDRIKV